MRLDLGKKKKKESEKQFVSAFREQDFQRNSVNSAVQSTGLEKNTK